MKNKVYILYSDYGKYEMEKETEKVYLGKSNKTLEELNIEWRKTWKPKMFPSGKHMGKMSKRTYETIPFEVWLEKKKHFISLEWEEFEITYYIRE